MGTELKASDIDNIARQMGDLDKNVISISRDMVGAEFNTKQYEKALIKTSSASKNLSSTLKVLGGVVASMAITFAIEKAIELTYALATSTQQLFKEAAQYGSEFKSIESDLDSYKTKITELQKKLSDSTTSYEDAKEARKQLMGIQSELISKYGSEEGAIRSITSAIDDQVDALDRLKDTEYLRLLGQFNDNSFSSFVEDPIKYIARWKDRAAYGLSDASDNGWEEVVLPSNSEMLQREMAHAMVDFHISDKDLATFKKNADKFKSIVVDDFGNVTGVGEIHDLKDDLSALFGVLEHSDISVRNLNKVSNEIHKLDTKINDGEEWSDYLTLRNSINGKDSSLNVESQYQSFIKAQEAYETAVVNGNKSMAEDLAIQMSEIYQNIYSKYGADNYLSGEERQVLNYFKRLSPEMSLEVAKFRNQLQKDLEFEPVVKANDIQIQDKEVLSEELSKYIREEINKATELGIDLSNTVYGNIDTTVRDRLEWTDENLEKFHDEILSWGMSPEELKGSISTVLGSMDEFDGIEIAYSPMLETDHGLELLSQETVNAYINRVLETAGDNKSLDNILKIDAEGFEIQGKKVKNLIADVGETAEKTSQSMHFTGLNGSIESAANELAALDIELNKLYDSNESLTSAFDSSLTRRLQNAIAMSDITLETLNKMDDVVNQYGEDALKDFGYTEIEIRVYKALNEILEEYGITVSQATHSMHEMKLVSTDLQKQLRNSFNSNDVKDYISTLSEEDLAILLKAHLDEDATLSEVKHAIEKGQYYADSNPITLTTRVDVATSDVSESVEKAFDAIEASYKSLLDSEGKFTAGSIDFDTQKSLAEIFGDTSGFEKYIDVLSDVSATEAEYQQAHDNLINNYINSQKFYDQVTESTANQVEAMLRAHNVTNAHEIVTEALNAKLAEEEARTQAVALADEYCAQAKTSLTEVSEKAEEQAYQDVYAFLEEKGASEETKYAITDLILATDAFSNTTIDISSKLNNLANLCSALGETELAAYAAAAAIESVGVAQAQAKAGATADERLGITAGAATESAGTKYASKDSAYRLATAKLKTKSSGQLHAGNIRNMKTDWGKAKQTALGGSGGKGSGGGGGGGGSSKDPTEEAKKDEEELEDTYDEFFDYFERRLKVVSDAISLLDAHLENVVGSNAKNTLLDAQMRIYKMQQQEYADAQNMYQEMADRALAKIEDSNIVEKIKNGAVGIDEFIGKGNEEVVNAINDYTKWADKVADCKQQLAELKETIRQLELTRMKNILQDWQDVFDLRQDNAIDLIDKQISLIEESGNLVGEAFYRTQKTQTEKQLSDMQNARNALVAELQKGLSEGTIERGTDEWIEEIKLITDCESAILDAKQAIEEYDNAILAIHTDTFDRLIDKFDDLNDELSDIAAFFDDEKVGDKFGNWSEAGQAQAGLLAQQYELAQNKVKKYADEINWLNGQYNAGKYSATEYAEQLAELMDAMRESAKDAESAKEAMLDLNKARVDIVIDGINEEIEAYSDLISKEKNALSAEKDLHDYRKQIADSNKSIVAIQRQLAAIENDNSQKARAQRLKLQQQLKDAQDSLTETEYDHSITVAQEALDEQLSAYKDTRQKEIDELNAYVENSQQVLTDMFEHVRAHAEEIGQTIVQTAQEHGFQVSTSLTESWKAGEDAIASYGVVLNEQSSAFIERLNEVEDETWELQEQSNQTSESIAAMFANKSDELVAELENARTSTENVKNTTDALNEAFVNAINTGGRIREVNAPMAEAEAATNAVADAANNAANAFDNMASSARAAGAAAADAQSKLNSYADAARSGIVIEGKSLTAGAGSIEFGTINLKKTKKHARGLSKAEQDELAWTQELGDEIIISPTRNSILTPIKKNDSVLTAEMTKNLFELAKIDPNDILQGSGAKVVAPQIESTNNSVSIGNLVNVEGSISSENLDAVKATIQSELKKTFRNINSGLRR